MTSEADHDGLNAGSGMWRADVHGADAVHFDELRPAATTTPAALLQI